MAGIHCSEIKNSVLCDRKNMKKIQIWPKKLIIFVPICLLYPYTSRLPVCVCGRGCGGGGGIMKICRIAPIVELPKQPDSNLCLIHASMFRDC